MQKAADYLRNFRTAWSQPRWRAALAAAVVSDALSFGLEGLSLGLAELPQMIVDLVTAVLVLALLGFRWGLAVPLVVEAFPGLALFPTWTLAVAAYAAMEKDAAKNGEPPAPPSAS